jgi:hypothetical protein
MYGSGCSSGAAGSAAAAAAAEAGAPGLELRFAVCWLLRLLALLAAL